MKERAEEITRAQGPRRPRAQAWARRHPRHRVRGAAAPTRARPRRRVACGRRRRSTRSHELARRRLRRPAPTPIGSTARTGSSARSSTASSSTTSSRRTRSRPTSTRASAWRGCSATATAPSAPRSSASRPSTASTSARSARIHERLFFAPLLETLAGHRRRSRPRRPRNASPRSASPTSSARAPRCASSPTGSPAARGSCSELLPVILEWLSETPDPDLGLLQLRRLVEGPARSASLAVTFRDAPGRGRARRATSSGPAGSSATRCAGTPSSSTPSTTTTRSRPRATRAELVADAFDTLEWRGDEEQRREGLRRFKRRELLRIATRDLLGLRARSKRPSASSRCWRRRASRPRWRRSARRSRSR